MKRTLKPALNFYFFITHWKNRAYEMDIFYELADKGLYSCTLVVDAQSQKNLRKREYKICLNDRAILRQSKCSRVKHHLLAHTRVVCESELAAKRKQPSSKPAHILGYYIQAGDENESYARGK